MWQKGQGCSAGAGLPSQCSKLLRWTPRHGGQRSQPMWGGKGQHHIVKGKVMVSLHMLEEAWGTAWDLFSLSSVALHILIEATITEPRYSGLRHRGRWEEHSPGRVQCAAHCVWSLGWAHAAPETRHGTSWCCSSLLRTHWSGTRWRWHLLDKCPTHLGEKLKDWEPQVRGAGSQIKIVWKGAFQQRTVIQTSCYLQSIAI